MSDLKSLKKYTAVVFSAINLALFLPKKARKKSGKTSGNFKKVTTLLSMTSKAVTVTYLYDNYYDKYISTSKTLKWIIYSIVFIHAALIGGFMYLLYRNPETNSSKEKTDQLLSEYVFPLADIALGVTHILVLILSKRGPNVYEIAYIADKLLSTCDLGPIDKGLQAVPFGRIALVVRALTKGVETSALTATKFV